MPHWTFFLVTFGCKVNQYESQALREAWQTLGGVECAHPSQADVVCINSCAITAKAERDARNAVYRLRRDAPQARLILTGCAARLVGDYVPHARALAPTPDLLVPQERKPSLLVGPWPDQNLQQPDFACGASHLNFPSFHLNGYARARPVLKVQDGCAHRCTYCIVPLTRGRPRSRPVRDCLAEARRLLAAGHVEIMISGINLRQYGRDTPTGDFWQLLAALDADLAPEYAHKARLRISSLEPGQLQGNGLDVLRSCRMLCPHVHVSLQHASPSVLKRMGRGHYSPALLESALETLARHWPVMGLGADILVGFPGESEADIRQLLDLIARLPWSYAHVFPYSPRPGTAAHDFGDHIPHALKLERAARVREAVAVQHRRFLQAQCGLSQMCVAWDRPSAPAAAMPNVDQGVNEYYVPCRLRRGTADRMQEDFSELTLVRPVDWDDDGLVVERIHSDHTQ